LSAHNIKRPPNWTRPARVSGEDQTCEDLDRALRIAAEITCDYGDRFLGFFQMIERRHAAHIAKSIEQQKARNLAANIASRRRANPAKALASASSAVSPSTKVQRRTLVAQAHGQTTQPAFVQASRLHSAGPEIRDEDYKK